MKFKIRTMDGMTHELEDVDSELIGDGMLQLFQPDKDEGQRMNFFPIRNIAWGMRDQSWEEK